MSKRVAVKIEYINKDDRESLKDPNLPEYQQKINEINLFVSETMSKIYELLPKYSSHTEACFDHEWTPYWIAVAEAILGFRLPLDLDESEYQIDTETCKITSIR